MNVFGAQNLEEAVERALDEEEIHLEETVSEEEIFLNFHQGVGPKKQVDIYAVFERLFNPENGYLREIDDYPDFRMDRTSLEPAVWDSEYRSETEVFLSADEIREIQKASIEESFADGYSEERFKELYEEVS